MDHIPLHVVTAGSPVCCVDSLVALDSYEILLSCQIAVEIVSSNYYSIVLGKTASSILHNGEGLGQNLIKFLLDLLINALYGLIDIFRDLLLLVE